MFPAASGLLPKLPCCTGFRVMALAHRGADIDRWSVFCVSWAGLGIDGPPIATIISLSQQRSGGVDCVILRMLPLRPPWEAAYVREGSIEYPFLLVVCISIYLGRCIVSLTAIY